LELLAGADIQFTRSNRLDVALCRNHNIALVFLPAADIPRFVGEGNIDLGITGQDMVAESESEAKIKGYATGKIKEAIALGFGKCKLQVQVPERSKDLVKVQDLLGKRIVTSFEHVAGEYFAKLDQEHGTKTLIEYVGGSVEAACALGVADGIVDLVESGETMRAAGLHAIETLISSEAVLIQSIQPKDPANLPLIEMITRRIEGVLAAQRFLLCTYNISRDQLHKATAITPGRRAATITPLEDKDWVAVSAMVLHKNSADIMDALLEVGAKDIFTMSLHNCRG